MEWSETERLLLSKFKSLHFEREIRVVPSNSFVSSLKKLRGEAIDHSGAGVLGIMKGLLETMALQLPYILASSE